MYLYGYYDLGLDMSIRAIF